MPPGVVPSQPGKIVEITYHEENSKLRLSDGPETSPVLIREGFILFTQSELRVLPQKVELQLIFSMGYIASKKTYF